MAATLARSHRSKARESGRGTALLKVGDLLAGKYRIERILGEGGMGVVVAAHHELLDQRVAVKLLSHDATDREAQSRLLLEARACAKLQSEHVARVIDVDTGADGLPFIVMELVEGADLCQVADARGALPRWLVVDYALQALEGLAHAHACGIVHRDLKPSNLFLANRADGTQIIKILDFGISKSMDPIGETTGERSRAAQLTGGRAVLGSPPYMSPEQVRSPKTVDGRTDIWSLGIVMYELLTNSMPFGGEEVSETFAQILEKEPQPIRQIVHGVPDGLERIVMRCLAKNRESRFTDVGELARALVAYGSGSWMQSADRVSATLARGLEDAASGPRLKGSRTSLDRLALPSVSSSRRVDAMQPELTGTASTVAGRFTRLGTSGRSLLALAGVISVAAVVVFAGIALQRSRAARAPAPSSALPREAPPEIAGVDATGTPLPRAATAAVNAAGRAPIGSAESAASGASASARRPALAAAQAATQKGLAAPASPPHKTVLGVTPAKPSLPAGLPRERN